MFRSEEKVKRFLLSEEIRRLFRVLEAEEFYTGVCTAVLGAVQTRKNTMIALRVLHGLLHDRTRGRADYKKCDSCSR